MITRTENGFVVFDSDIQELRTYTKLKEPITTLVSNKDIVVHGSSHSNSLRKLKHDLTKYEKFPVSKFKINPNSRAATEILTEHFSDSRYITSLKLKYT